MGNFCGILKFFHLFIKLKKQKYSNELGSNSSNTFGNWDGTEKQLEKIMYKD